MIQFIFHPYSISFHIHPVRGRDTPFARPGLWRLLRRGRKCRWSLTERFWQILKVSLENVWLYGIISTYLNYKEDTKTEKKEMFWALGHRNFQVCTAGCVAGDNVTLQPLSCWARLKMRTWYLVFGWFWSACRTEAKWKDQVLCGQVLLWTRKLYWDQQTRWIQRYPEEGKHGAEMCGRHDKNGARGRSLFSGRTGRTLPDGSAAPLATGDDAHWGQNKDVLHHFERQEDRKIREGNWMKLVEVLV